MGAIRLLAAPIRRLANSPLFQLAFVVAIILLLDRYSYDYAPLRPIADGLESVVTATVNLCSDCFRVGILTDPVLQVAPTIIHVYVHPCLRPSVSTSIHVYVVCLLIFFLLRVAIRAMADLVGWRRRHGRDKRAPALLPGPRHASTTKFWRSEAAQFRANRESAQSRYRI